MLPNLSRRHLPISALHNRLKGFRDPQNRPLNSGVLGPPLEHAGAEAGHTSAAEALSRLRSEPDR